MTAGGVLFIASTDDNRFRAFEAKTGKQLWVTRLERRGNADPLTYQGGNGKQYVAVVATGHAGGVRAAVNGAQLPSKKKHHDSPRWRNSGPSGQPRSGERPDTRARTSTHPNSAPK